MWQVAGHEQILATEPFRLGPGPTLVSGPGLPNPRNRRLAPLPGSPCAFCTEQAEDVGVAARAFPRGGQGLKDLQFSGSSTLNEPNINYEYFIND